VPEGNAEVSKTVAVTFGEDWFWAYDVSFSILLLTSIRIAESGPPDEQPPWLNDVLDTLRSHALLGANLAFPLDGEWDQAQQHYVLSAIAAAGEVLRAQRSITAAEAADRYIVGGEPLFLRGADVIDATAVADLADAIARLVRGVLAPPPPPAQRWFFGAEGGPGTL
jgi:hypothetical protein